MLKLRIERSDSSSTQGSAIDEGRRRARPGFGGASSACVNRGHLKDSGRQM